MTEEFKLKVERGGDYNARFDAALDELIKDGAIYNAERGLIFTKKQKERMAAKVMEINKDNDNGARMVLRQKFFELGIKPGDIVNLDAESESYDPEKHSGEIVYRLNNYRGRYKSIDGGNMQLEIKLNNSTIGDENVPLHEIVGIEKSHYDEPGETNWRLSDTRSKRMYELPH